MGQQSGTTSAFESEQALAESTSSVEPGTGSVPGPHGRVVGIEDANRESDCRKLGLVVVFPDGETDTLWFENPATAPSESLQVLADYCDVSLAERRFGDFLEQDIPVRAVCDEASGTRTGWEVDLGSSTSALEFRRRLQQYGLVRREDPTDARSPKTQFEKLVYGVEEGAAFRPTPSLILGVGVVTIAGLSLGNFLPGIASLMMTGGVLTGLLTFVAVFWWLLANSSLGSPAPKPTTADPHWEPWGSIRNLL